MSFHENQRLPLIDLREGRGLTKSPSEFETQDSAEGLKEQGSGWLRNNDSASVVNMYWTASFAHRRKRKLVRTESKIRQHQQLGEWLQKLEKETGLWRGEFSQRTGAAHVS